MPSFAVSLLVIARGLFGLLSSDASEKSEIYADEIQAYLDAECDDGTKAFDEYGSVRLECTIDGCWPVDEVCYRGTYFEDCLDLYGRPTGNCRTTKSDCEGVFSCAILWIECKGQYECKDDKLIGCGKGTCEEKISRYQSI